MKHLIFFVFASLFIFNIKAEDVIVMRNGDLVKAIVIEITQNEVKYRKASNPNGPIYTNVKSDIIAINYENGDKDTFEANKPASHQSSAGEPQYVSPVAASDNATLIAYYNSATPRHKKNQPDENKAKETNSYMAVYGITPSSILSDDNITISFQRNDVFHAFDDAYFGKEFPTDYFKYQDNYKVFIKNKSSKPIYVDITNSFRIYPTGEAESLYNNINVTHNTSSRSDIGIGLGAVTSALGVGGLVGTLASGIGIGGGSSHSTSISETESTIISIPPNGKIEIPAKIYTNDKNTKSVKNYEIFNFPDIFATVGGNKPEKWKFTDTGDKYIDECMNYIITYSTSRNFAEYTALNVGIFVRGIIGVGFRTNACDIVVDNGPVFFSSSKHHSF